MKIGFFCMSEPHLEFARLMVESVNRVMPGVEIVHLTNGACPTIEGVTVKRLDGDMPMAVRRMTLHSQCDGDWLFIDSDIILNKDVRDVFDAHFDIAVTDRIGTYMEHTPYGKAMPYNMGVTFSRSAQFWLDVRKFLLMQPAHLQRWEGDQRMVCAMVDRCQDDYDFKILPGRVYNFTPEHERESVEHAAILHYKGGRKAWMLSKSAA